MESRRHTMSRAFTLLELIVAIGLVAILAAVSIPSYRAYQERARRVVCISKMRTIHQGLLDATNDLGHWPQMEEERFKFTEDEFFEFWVKVTEPYGLSEETWICPSDRALERKLKAKDKKFMGSYVVTRFDERASTPYRWNQPWAMERGNFHGQGAHILMPDGSVHPMLNPFAGR